MSLSYVQSGTLYLSGSGVIVGATTVSLTSFTDIYGNVLTMSSFGAKGYITLEPDTTNEEAATFTGVTANANGTFTLTGVATLLAQTPYTESSGLVRQHSGGTKVVITDNVGFWNTFPNKQNDETITGTWTFNTAPVALSATPASTTVLGNVRATVTPSTTLGNPTITIASPAVITLNSHGLTANDTVRFTTTGALPTGLATATTYFVISTGLTTNAFEVSLTVGGTAVNTSGTQSGTHTLIRTTPYAIENDDPRIFPTAYGVDTGTANVYVLTLSTAPAKYATGQLYSFKASNSNTTSSTIAINGLTATAIVNIDGTSLSANAIVSGDIYLLQYDGTSFRILNAPSAQSNYQVFTSNGTWTKPSGLSGNEMVLVQVWGGGAGGFAGGGAGGGGSYVEYRVAASALTSTVTVTVAAAVGAATVGNNTTFGTYVTAYGGGAGQSTNGGGGGGTLSAGSASAGGNPLAGAFGGGAGTSTTGGSSGWGGGAGGGGGATIGGSSTYGGGGGAGISGTAGTSLYGGNGGVGSSAGTAPGGGGGGNSGGGARGEVRVFVI